MADSAYTLVIGTKQYSSWSLRPWVLMKHVGIPFTETLIDLRQTSTSPKIREHSPAGLVPILKDGALTIWDSLAIAEYLNEEHPDKRLWPSDRATRARARSVAAEMHSGFRELRMALSMDFTARGLPSEIFEATARDIRRIVDIWRESRRDHAAEGPYLFGAFSVADAMFAPVVSRFTSFDVPLKDYGDDGSAEAYRAMMIELPAMKGWAADCKPWRPEQRI